MKKPERIYLVSCLVLLIVCIVAYKPLERICLIYTRENFSFFAALLFSVLVAIYMNVFFGLKGGVERFFGTLLGICFTYALVGGLFEGIDWLLEHVKIVP